MRSYSIILTLLLSVSATAQINQTYKREVILQRVKDGRVVQEHVRRSQFVRDDRGKLIETVLFKTPGFKEVDGLEDFTWGRPTKERPGLQMISKDYAFGEFGSTVEVKDVWDAHWPAGTRVKVYFSADFNKDLPVLMEVLNAWNSLIPEVRFAYAGTSEIAQECESCLTVLRNPNLKDYGTFQYADRGDGMIVFGRIYLRRLDSNTLFSIFAHELGHSLGLPHTDQGLMREKLPKGRLSRPTQREAAIIRSFLDAD